MGRCFFRWDFLPLCKLCWLFQISFSGVMHSSHIFFTFSGEILSSYIFFQMQQQFTRSQINLINRLIFELSALHDYGYSQTKFYVLLMFLARELLALKALAIVLIFRKFNFSNLSQDKNRQVVLPTHLYFAYIIIIYQTPSKNHDYKIQITAKKNFNPRYFINIYI